MTERIIVTGGAGYIGSHVAVELLAAGHAVLIIDNFDNSPPKAVERVGEIAPGDLSLLECDLANQDSYDRIAKAALDFGATGAVHLAGLKAVGESVSKPLAYYENNVGGTITLLNAMAEASCARAIGVLKA